MIGISMQSYLKELHLDSVNWLENSDFFQGIGPLLENIESLTLCLGSSQFAETKGLFALLPKCHSICVYSPRIAFGDLLELVSSFTRLEHLEIHDAQVQQSDVHTLNHFLSSHKTLQFVQISKFSGSFKSNWIDSLLSVCVTHPKLVHLDLIGFIDTSFDSLLSMEQKIHQVRTSIRTHVRLCVDFQSSLSKVSQDSIEPFQLLIDSDGKFEYMVDVNAHPLSQLLTKAFLVAAENGQIKIVTYLLDQGVNVNVKEIWSALNCAAYNGHTEIAKYLLDNGANVNDLDPWAALHCAAYNGHTEIAKYLLDNGANVNLQDDCQNTALHYAAKRGHTEIAKYLIDNGANVNAKNHQRVGDYYYQRTALRYAAHGGHTEIAKYLIDNGAVNSNQLLTTAFLTATENGQIKIVNNLIQLLHNSLGHEEKDINKRGIILNEGNVFSWIQAIINPDISPLSQLLAKAFHTAAGNGHLKIVTYLLDQGVNVNVKDDYQKTALYYATKKGHCEIVKYLIDNGAM